MNIETIGLGAGSYPEPPEPKNKSYQFDFNGTISGYGVVFATDEETARDRINQNNYDEIIETYNLEITEIENIKED